MTNLPRRRAISLFAATTLSLTLGGLAALPASADPDGQLVKVVATGPDSISRAQVAASLGAYTAASVGTIHSGAGGSVVTVETADPDATISQMEASGLYRGVGLVTAYQAFALPSPPNDPLFSMTEQYALRNDQGSSAWGSSTRVGARFQQAWPLVGGSDTTAPVAVVDTGLPANLSSELTQVAGKWDTADNDSNVRFPSSVYAWGTSEPFHGAAVSSILGAKTNNGAVMAGAAQNTQIYFYKTQKDSDALNGVGDMYNDAVASAIRMAVQDGAKV
ncbi:MAG: S8 family serine peptidase, partial [Bifidobacteriaceae bacterium]|nr:S8 family serine peptidase [Bifidobacteriaceae bacterium]